MPSIRVRRFLHERNLQRQAARLARQAADRELVAEYERDYLDRERAAVHLGISIHKLRRAITAGTSPAYIKHGAAAQATVRFPRSELDEYLANPAAYLTTRDERMAAWAKAAAANG